MEGISSRGEAENSLMRIRTIPNRWNPPTLDCEGLMASSKNHPIILIPRARTALLLPADGNTIISSSGSALPGSNAHDGGETSGTDARWFCAPFENFNPVLTLTPEKAA